MEFNQQKIVLILTFKKGRQTVFEAHENVPSTHKVFDKGNIEIEYHERPNLIIRELSRSLFDRHNTQNAV